MLSKSRIMGPHFIYQTEPVYDFTNENTTELNRICNFEGKKVLTVLGSGDQYFTAKLYGAKQVDVIDTNCYTWYYFIIKQWAFKCLKYEDFYRLFIEKVWTDKKINNRFQIFAPDDVKTSVSLANNFLLTVVPHTSFKPPLRDDGSIIPYFSEENYKKLQDILRGDKTPLFINENFFQYEASKPYDITILSNIYNFSGMSKEEFKAYLMRFNSSEILALYGWHMNESTQQEWADLGFEIHEVASSVPTNEKKTDIILSLRK